jgi:hypothetical protein
MFQGNQQKKELLDLTIKLVHLSVKDTDGDLNLLQRDRQLGWLRVIDFHHKFQIT